MREKYGVNLLCDNNPEKWGKEFHGVVCVKPQDLKEYENIVVIIMLGNSAQVEEQLENMNIPYVNHLELSLDEIMNMQSDMEWFKNECNTILQVYDLLSDDESKKFGPMPFVIVLLPSMLNMDGNNCIAECPIISTENT